MLFLQFILAAGLFGTAQAIVGGQDAPFTPSPIVAIFERSFTGQSLICSGFFFNHRKVATAAACCVGRGGADLQVQWGGNDRTRFRFRSEVIDLVFHPNWDPTSKDHNYCVLTLAFVASGTDGALHAKLSSDPPSSLEGTTLSTFGWGQRCSDNAALPITLQTAPQTVVSHDDCVATWEGETTITENMMCVQAASPEFPAASICKGDVGSPLMDARGTTAYGIASFPGKGCTSAPKPNVFSTLDVEWLTTQ